MVAKRAFATALLVAARFAVPAGAAAQDAPPADAAPPVTDASGAPSAAAGSEAAPVDFVIRPTEGIDDDEGDDIWNWNDTEAPVTTDAPVGPPLAGPTGTEPVGPPLAGPEPTPVPAPRRRPQLREAATDPFAQQGIALGSFVIRPSIEIGVTATSNAAGSPDNVGAVGLLVAPEVNVTSKGDRYEFEADAAAEGVWYDDSDFDGQTAAARASLRYDVTRSSSIYADANYARYLEGFSDPDTPAAATKRPAVDEVDASLGFEQRFGRLSTRLTAFADRAMHDDVPLSDGTVASRAELDNTEYGVRLRTGYATSASLRPFVEASVGRRNFDQAEDDSGFARSSVWGQLIGGLVIDRGEKLSGEASIGYRREDLKDDRLEDVNAFLANAAIIWSPRRLTEVKIDLSTSVNPTSTPDTSATVLYAGTLTLSRSLTPRLTAETGVGASYEDRIGDDWRDVTLSGFAGFTYAFNRTVSLEGRYVYEHTDRNETGGTYDTHTVGLRIRVQR
jgi:hypothetical protein